MRRIAVGLRGDAARAVAGALAFALVLALGSWIISPRFAIDAPSVVDDWSAIDNSPHALDRLVALDYDPDAVHDPHRYRPGYLAVWNSLQWHTLGAPGGLTGPNFWNLLRLALFVAALALVPIAVALSSARRSIGPVWLGILAAAPPAMVLASPKTGEDFARFGPVEPILVGGMMAGAALLLYATGRWIGRRTLASRRALAATVALALAGYALWLLGVYSKEASVCFLVMAPFLYLFLDRRWRESGVTDRPLLRYRPFQLVAIAMLLPVVHMAIEVLKLAGEGTTVYGAPVPSGTGGTFERVRTAFDIQWNSMTILLETSFWKGFSMFLPLLLVAVAVRRRRVPWLAAGLIATGWAALVFQGLSGTATARYYIPTMALFGVAAALLLAQSRVWPRVAAIGIAALFVVANADGSRDTVEAWAGGDRDGNRAVTLVAALNPDRCAFYMSGLEEEVADAFPELVALRRPFPPGGCGGKEAFMLRRQHPDRITPVTNERIMRACAGSGWSQYAETEIWQILACRRLRKGYVGPQPVREVLAEDKLVPGQRFSERKRLLTSTRQ